MVPNWIWYSVLVQINKESTVSMPRIIEKHPTKKKRMSDGLFRLLKAKSKKISLHRVLVSDE